MQCRNTVNHLDFLISNIFYSCLEICKFQMYVMPWQLLRFPYLVDGCHIAKIHSYLELYLFALFVESLQRTVLIPDT